MYRKQLVFSAVILAETVSLYSRYFNMKENTCILLNFIPFKLGHAFVVDLKVNGICLSVNFYQFLLLFVCLFVEEVQRGNTRMVVKQLN